MAEKKGTEIVQAQNMKDKVLQKLNAYQEAGAIHFPANYSPQNALQSAWLVLQTVKDKNRRPALEVCTKASIANALLYTVISGLSPAKNQVYFLIDTSVLR